MTTPHAPTTPDTLDAWLLLAREARASTSASADEGLRASQAAIALARERGERAALAEASHLRCYFEYRLGAFARLLEIGAEALDALRDQRRIESTIEVLRWMTQAAAELGRFETAMQCAQQACEAADRADDPRLRALALTGLAGCFERMGDPWQAERLMLEVLTLMRAHGSTFDRMQALNNLAAVLIGAFYLLRGGEDGTEARLALRRGWSHAAEALPLAIELGDPLYRIFVEANLGEILLHLGELDEAELRLQRSLDTATGRYPAQSWRIRCSIGELLLERGRADEARTMLEGVLRDMHGADVRATLFRARHALYRACRMLGREEEALQHLEEYQRIERRRATAQLKAQSQFFVTRVEAEQARLQADRARLEAQLQSIRAAEFEAHALRDALTGLPNRRHLDQVLPPLLESARRRNAPLTLAVIDLDHFKRVNDRFGHALGDRVLMALAQLLRENTRGSDALARLGGEEFIVVLAETGAETALEVLERLRRFVEAYDWAALAPGLSVTLSIGRAEAPPYDAQTLFETADAALYRAKQGGRNRIEG